MSMSTSKKCYICYVQKNADDKLRGKDIESCAEPEYSVQNDWKPRSNRAYMPMPLFYEGSPKGEPSCRCQVLRAMKKCAGLCPAHKEAEERPKTDLDPLLRSLPTEQQSQREVELLRSEMVRDQLQSLFLSL